MAHALLQKWQQYAVLKACMHHKAASCTNDWVSSLKISKTPIPMRRRIILCLSGGLFGGIEEPTTIGGKSDTPESSFSRQVSSTIGGVPSARKGNGDGGMFSDAEPTPVFPALQAGARLGGGISDIGAESGGLFDSLPLPSEVDNKPGVPTPVVPNEKASDEIDDFFSTLESVASGGGNSDPPPVRGPIFGHDASAGGESEDDVFASPFTADADQVTGGRGLTASSDTVRHSALAGGAGTSLFDRPEFSIDSADKDGKMFGLGGGGGGEEGRVSFLSAMGVTDRSLGGDGGGKGGEGDDDREGMVEVSF